jgi:molecular chaperone Hsp33
MLEQEGRAEVTCHFCNKKYVFDADDLKKILEA